MNSIAIIFLAVVCYASGEVFLSDSSFAETKALNEQETRQFFPFIPLNFIPIPKPATPVVAPAPAPVVVPPLAACPAACCKKYCKDGLTCTPGATAATPPTCTATTGTPVGQCHSPETTGCGARACKPRATCQTNCANVIDIIDPAFCP